MINIDLIRKDPQWVTEQLTKRDYVVDFNGLLKADTEKRALQSKTDELKSKRNIGSKGKPTAEQIAEMKKIGEAIAGNDAKIKELEKKIYDFMVSIPNIPADDVVPGGKRNNKVLRTFGERQAAGNSHYDICVDLGLIDYERAAKISGTKTWIYTDQGAMLEWALLNYFIDFHISNGYKFLLLPHLLNYQSGLVAGQFPKFADDVFMVDDKFLLPTAETALINLHRDEIIKTLPIKYAGYTPCYRKEAGSYRADERGMIRGYQFNKVEMFVFCEPKDTDAFFAELVGYAEELVKGLGLTYQVVALAAGDMSSAMTRTHDIEVFIPSMNKYIEVSSVSACGDYQSRRGMIRFKGDKGTEYVHTLNASGLATSRLIPAIVEQFYRPDGTVEIPKVLHKYIHGLTILGK